MSERWDTEFDGYRIYVQPGGCVEIQEMEPDTCDRGAHFLHVCDWGRLVTAVGAEIDRRQPYRDPRDDS